MDIFRRAGVIIVPIVFLLAGQITAFSQPDSGSNDSVEGTELLAKPDTEEPIFVEGETGMFDSPENLDGEPFPTTGIWNILFALGLVLLTFWVIFRFVIRPLMRGAVLGRGIENFRIIATLPIAPTKSIQVVKLVDRLIVIGIAEGGMNQLSEITDPSVVSEMLAALDVKNPAKHHPFKKAFDTILTRKDETGFEDKQKKFNSTLEDLKDKIQAMKDSPTGDSD